MRLGEKIKEVFEAKGIKLIDFADQIGTVRQNVYRLFERDSLDSDLLYKISQVLDYDFFQHYQVSPANKPSTSNEGISINEIAVLKDELETARKEIEYLRRIVSMREEEKQLMEAKYKTQMELSEAIVHHLREKEKSYQSQIQALASNNR